MICLKRITLSLFIAALINLQASVAKADAGREFLLSCTYGVLAGSLVGAATLAVEDNPGDKLDRIAKGASLGLYAGILLGLYVVYVVPSQYESPAEEQLEEFQDKIEPDDYGSRMRPRIPKLTFYPVFEQQKITGAAFNYNVMQF